MLYITFYDVAVCNNSLLETTRSEILHHTATGWMPKTQPWVYGTDPWTFYQLWIHVCKVQNQRKPRKTYKNTFRGGKTLKPKERSIQSIGYWFFSGQRGRETERGANTSNTAFIFSSAGSRWVPWCLFYSLNGTYILYIHLLIWHISQQIAKTY